MLQPLTGWYNVVKPDSYGLNRIKAKTAKTSYAWINSIFLVMNLLVLLRSFLPSAVIYDLIRQLKIQIGRYYDDGNQMAV